MSAKRRDVETLERALGYHFRDQRLLETALIHRSRSHEQGAGPAANYERLEFLGDALLGFLVADWLYRDDASVSEGVLSRRRQAIVRRATLAEVAHGLGLGEAVRLGRGEEGTGGREKRSLLADLFESVLGAVYLDGGIRAARAFVRRHLGAGLRGVRHSTRSRDDHKTRLQEATQARLRRTPRYRIVSTTGPDHALEFEVEVLLGDEILGAGWGSNRKRAEQAAAREALMRLGEWEEEP
jgi:ribonuclease-3